MKARSLSFCVAASALLAASITPAFAQIDPANLPPVPVDPSVKTLPDAPDTPVIANPAPAYPAPVYPAPAYPVAAYPAPQMAPNATYTGSAPASLPPEYQQARADWVAECVDRYRDDRRDGNGGLIGGLIGSVLGGFAGNRIDDHGDRWAGTLIGAGIGGVAGAVLGTVAGKSRRRNDDKAIAWCEDYLARHSSAPAYGGPQYGAYGYGQPYGYGQQSYGPVMMVPMMVPKKRNCDCRETMVEEVIEPRPISRYIPPRAPDKRIKLVPAKTKNMKYIKSQ